MKPTWQIGIEIGDEVRLDGKSIGLVHCWSDGGVVVMLPHSHPVQNGDTVTCRVAAIEVLTDEIESGVYEVVKRMAKVPA